MALVAVRAVVHVPLHASVMWVGRSLGMASGAGKDGVIRRIGMTGGTHSTRVPVISWEPGVIESRPRPRRCRVTGRASSRKASGRMIWIGRSLVVGFVARIAIGRNRCVVIVDVTTRAGHAGVCARKWERRVVVIKRRRNPCRRVVAEFAGLRKPSRHVVRIRGSVVCAQVTGNARGR